MLARHDHLRSVVSLSGVKLGVCTNRRFLKVGVRTNRRFVKVGVRTNRRLVKVGVRTNRLFLVLILCQVASDATDPILMCSSIFMCLQHGEDRQIWRTLKAF